MSAVSDYNRRFLSLLPTRPWVNVRIVLEENPCEHCAARDLAPERDDLPALPHRFCTKPHGCGCWYVAVPRTYSVKHVGQEALT